MALRIFTNISSLNSQRALEANRIKLGSTISRIASGVRINGAQDDAGGLALSESLRSDVRALKQGARNLNDGTALINTADGALQQQASMMIRLRELASQAATGTIGQTERATLNLEFNALKTEFDRIANTTEFNGQKLLDGSLAANAPQSLVLQVGLNSDEESRFNLNQELDLTASTTAAFGLDGQNILTTDQALQAMDRLTEGVKELTALRGQVGTTLNRLQRALNTLNISIENLTSAVSRIRDTDMAEEFADLTKQQILVQAGGAMVGQANLIPQSVLTLLQ